MIPRTEACKGLRILQISGRLLLRWDPDDEEDVTEL